MSIENIHNLLDEKLSVTQAIVYSQTSRNEFNKRDCSSYCMLFYYLEQIWKQQSISKS